MLRAAGLTSCWGQEEKKGGESPLTGKRRQSHYGGGRKRALCQGHWDQLFCGQGVWRRRTDLGELGSVFFGPPSGCAPRGDQGEVAERGGGLGREGSPRQEGHEFQAPEDEPLLGGGPLEVGAPVSHGASEHSCRMGGSALHSQGHLGVGGDRGGEGEARETWCDGACSLASSACTWWEFRSEAPESHSWLREVGGQK